VLVGHRPETLVAGKRRQRIDVVGVGWLGKRGWSTGTRGQVFETLKERSDLRALLARLVRNVRCREQSLQGKALADGWRLILLVKGDLANLVSLERSVSV